MNLRPFQRGSANVFIGHHNAVPVPEANDFRYAIEDMPADQNSLLMLIEDVVPGTTYMLVSWNLAINSSMHLLGWYFIRVVGTAEESSFTMKMFPPGFEFSCAY